MLDPFFKNFYKQDLEKSDFLESILKTGRPDILCEILNDPAYKFNKNFIFNHIANLIKQRDDNVEVEEDELK